LRHFNYGKALGDMDIDSEPGVFVEYLYNNNHPSSLIEYKHGNISYLDLGHKQIKRIAHLAQNRNGTIPAFVCVYYFFKKDGSLLEADEERDNLSLLDHVQFLVIGLNHKAISYLHGNHAEQMRETTWVKFLHELRGIPMEEGLNLYNELWNIHPLDIKNLDIIYDD
jgi:hypothetical protein